MKKVLLLVIAALLIPGAALAKGKPPVTGPGSHGKSAPKVVYVLKGTLSGYSAYDSGTSTNGSITILVSKANYHGKALKGQTLTFPVGPKTKVTLEDGVTAVTDNDKGIVKVRAPKRIAAADLASTLQTYNAKQIVDKGTTSG